MKKTLLFVILMNVAVFFFFLNVVSQEDSNFVARNFMTDFCQKENISLDLFTLSEIVTDANGEPLYYNFDMAGGGFILISATNLVDPVLAYSFESRFEENERTSYFVKKYKAAIQQVKETPRLQEISASTNWNHYLKNDFTPAKTRATTLVEPLLPTTWSQERYYNQYCPYDPAASGDFDMRTVVGCVALTMANLMYYYRYPSALPVGVSYFHAPEKEPLGFYHANYGLLEAFKGERYDYDYITHNINAYQGNLSRLIYHAGISVKMSYGPDGSASQSGWVGEQISELWKFSSGIFEEREGETTISYADWENKVISELEAQRPVYYSGISNARGGHAWIIDGYIFHSDNKNYFHVNWGWGGSNNGFYKLEALVTNQGTYSDQGENFYRRLAPDSIAILKPDSMYKRLTGFRGSISDGAGNAGYPLKAEYKWTIATSGASSYILTPKKIKILADDVISIYRYQNGQLVSVPVAIWQGEYLMPGCTDRSGTMNTLSFPGVPLPSPLNVTGDSLLIVFTSNTAPTSNTVLSSDIARHLTGININYEAKYAGQTQYCSSTSQVIREKEGTISDKNLTLGIDQNTPYRAESKCTWNIQLDQNQIDQQAIDFSFEHFNLGEGDVIDIYSASLSSTNPKPILLCRFDKNNPPSGGYHHEGSRLHIRLNVDNYDEGTGFVLKYNGTPSTGIYEKNSKFKDVTIYPNPTSDKLYTEFQIAEAGMITFQILDITGRVITMETVNHQGGALKHETSVNGLVTGIYLIKVSNEKEYFMNKFIVK
jgi:hypothetical protein